MMAFLLKGRSLLKLYLLNWLAEEKHYAYDMLTDLRKRFKDESYSPSHSEMYDTLKDLWANGYVERKKKRRGHTLEEFQEIVEYQLTDKGKEYQEEYKKMMKVELERCERLLRKAIEDHY